MICPMYPMPSLDRFVESNLPKRCPGICICGEQEIKIRINKNAYWKRADAKEDLCGSFVLPVEYVNFSIGRSLRIDPRQPSVKLWSPFVKLLDQPANIRSNRTWIDALVMMYIFNW